MELRREISTHDSDLEEIRDDDPNDMEEEVITVEYNNLTSQRVTINRFIEDLPYRKNSDALEREFNVCLIILFRLISNGNYYAFRILLCNIIYLSPQLPFL